MKVFQSLIVLLHFIPSQYHGQPFFGFVVDSNEMQL